MRKKHLQPITKKFLETNSHLHYLEIAEKLECTGPAVINAAKRLNVTLTGHKKRQRKIVVTNRAAATVSEKEGKLGAELIKTNTSPVDQVPVQIQPPYETVGMTAEQLGVEIKILQPVDPTKPKDVPKLTQHKHGKRGRGRPRKNLVPVSP